MSDDKRNLFWSAFSTFIGQLFLLIVATILASTFVPSCLQTIEERKWQYEAREEMLVRLDEVAGEMLLNLRRPERYQKTSLEELERIDAESCIKMNYAMVRIRLLYGTRILKEFINEVDSPLKKFLYEAITAKKRNDIQFKKKIVQECNELIQIVDKWEDKFTVTKFKPLE